MQSPEIKVETEDWKLGCYMDWREKHHSVPCTHCNGEGEIGGGFKDIDGARPCPSCYGSGHKTVGPTTPKPELPEALVEHMRRAWWDFFNKPETKE